MLAIAASALVILLAPRVSYPPGLRVPAGLVLTMIGPGYAGLALLRPRWLRPWLHAGLSLPLSFAVVIVYSAALDAAPGGVAASRVTVGIAVITLALVAGWWRFGRRAAAPRAARKWPRPSPGRIVAAAPLAVALAWAAFSLAHAAHVDRTPRYTALFASEQSPGVSQPGGTDTIALGVVNREGATRHYQLTLSTSNVATRQPAATVSLGLKLRQGERATRRLSVPCAGVTLVRLKALGAHPIRRQLVLRPACGNG
jgi:uncharacterized membrane protein